MSQELFRSVLKANADGLTATQLAKLASKHRNNVTVALAAMPDVYIDRWVKATRGPYLHAPVYVAVQVPENAPRPD